MKKTYKVGAFSKIALIVMIVLTIGTPVLAATRDFRNLKTNKVVTANEWRFNNIIFNELVNDLEVNPQDYTIEFTSKQYSYKKVYDALINGTGTMDERFTKALADTNNLADVSNDLYVQSIE